LLIGNLISPRVKKNEEIILWQEPDTQQFPHFQRGKPHPAPPLQLCLLPTAAAGMTHSSTTHNAAISS